MKRLFIALMALAVFACQEEPNIDYAILSGKVENARATMAVINSADFEKEIALDENGAFSDTLRIPEAGFYSFTIGREYTPLYLGMGDSIHVNVDAQKFDESITYSGEGAAENNYLAAKTLHSIKTTSNAAELYGADESAFKNKVAEITATNNDRLMALTDADAQFVTDEKQNLVYDEYAMLNNYEQAHSRYAQLPDFKVSEDFLPEALKNISFDDPKAYKTSRSYKNMAFNEVMTEVFDAIGSDPSSATLENLSAIEAIKIPALKNDVVDYLGSFLVSPGNPNMEAIYNFFKNNTTDEDTKSKLTEIFEKNKNLVRGNPSPQFVNYENHKGGETSLSDLKGKYVYIDVWATWCGPCIREIPSLKEVEKQFHDENIAFVSTSIDQAKDHDKWVAMVNDRSLGGIQLMADKDWQSDFVKDYAIQGIPRFILVDPEGNIVSADAPRPSDPKLVDLLEKELEL